MEDNPNSMSKKEKLELALWLIERHDNLRATVSNRAAMVISADAILLASATFLIDRGISVYTVVDLPTTIYLVSSFAAIVLVLFSIFYASNSIVFVWRPTVRSIGIKDLPKALFFYPSDTVNALDEFEKFENEFQGSTTDDMLKRALSELMHIIYAHHKRYKSLRRSIRLFLITIFPLIVCLLLLIMNYLV